MYKIGRTERGVEARVRELEKHNNEPYTVERKVETQWNRAFEELLHIKLADCRLAPMSGERGTEWFAASLPKINRAIEEVTCHLNYAHGQ